MADIIAGKDAVQGILAALWARERTAGPLPKAQRRLVISLAHSAVAALVNVAQNVMVSGRDAGRFGNAHPNLVPYQAFRASDGYIVIGVGNNAQWSRCCPALDLGSLGDDPALAANAGRLAHRDRVVADMARRVAERSSAEWLARLTELNVPCGRVRSVHEALGDVDHSPLTGVAPAIPGSVRFKPPLLDEQGAEIRQLGWSAFNRGYGIGG